MQNYAPPDHKDFLTPEEIKSRYQDASLVIFKELKNTEANFLSFGTSRRTVEFSNYGNDPVIIKAKSVGARGGQDGEKMKQSNICSIN